MLNKLMKLKNKKGFTLVELIVVIAIIAILTAIIVPLVGRYSAQARYTTLNDAATTISNSVNSGLSDANQIGVINVSEVTGQKDAQGVLTVVVGTATKVGEADVVASSGSGDVSPADQRAAERIYASLANALPATCTFYASVSTSTVAGVVYYNSKADALEASDVQTAGTGEGAAPTFDKFGFVKDFDNAYAEIGTGTGASVNDAKGQAVGLTGQYIPHTSDDEGE